MSEKRLFWWLSLAFFCGALVHWASNWAIYGKEVRQAYSERSALKDKIITLEARTCSPAIQDWNEVRTTLDEGPYAVTAATKQYPVVGIWYQAVTLQRYSAPGEYNVGETYHQPVFVHIGQVPLVQGEPLVGQWCYPHANSCQIPGTDKHNQG